VKGTKEDLGFLRMMWRIRLFEERVDSLFGEGVLLGTTHLSVGQEAVAVGAVSALGPDDCIVSNHRGHGHMLARGAEPARVMAELMGKATGYCAGRGGSQHMCAIDIGFLGTNGITGGGLPIATGAALAAKYHGEGRVVLCFFGDGASNQGTFHESLNMAAIWSLPIVFLCENNLYGMSTHVNKVMKVKHVSDRASAYGMPGVMTDGMDVHKVQTVTLEAVERARKGEGPTLIEAKTYRYHGHSKSDRRIYRTREEEARWRQRDPIPVLAASLASRGVSAAQLEDMRREEEQMISEAVRHAREDAFAPAERESAHA
jgi:acetoin:2,6-dichlorophenolindophenol oxidoreductase subunit alpha